MMWCDDVLQPWRYMDAGVRARGGEETSAVSVDSAWQQFVADNILFYTSLLKLLLLRSLVEFSFQNGMCVIVWISVCPEALRIRIRNLFWLVSSWIIFLWLFWQNKLYKLGIFTRKSTVICCWLHICCIFFEMFEKSFCSHLVFCTKTNSVFSLSPDLGSHHYQNHFGRWISKKPSEPQHWCPAGVITVPEASQIIRWR